MNDWSEQQSFKSVELAKLEGGEPINFLVPIGCKVGPDGQDIHGRKICDELRFEMIQGTNTKVTYSLCFKKMDDGSLKVIAYQCQSDTLMMYQNCKAEHTDSDIFCKVKLQDASLPYVVDFEPRKKSSYFSLDKKKILTKLLPDTTEISRQIKSLMKSDNGHRLYAQKTQG